MAAHERRETGGVENSSLPGLEEIVTRHYGRMLSFMLTRLPDRDTAQDLTQDVFLRFLKTNPPACKIQGNEAQYLYGIANNTIKDHWAGKSKDPARPGEELENLKAATGNVEQGRIDSYSLEKCLERLKAIDSRIVTLRMWNGESHLEIARFLGMTKENVRKRLQRSLVSLKRCLKGSLPQRIPRTKERA